MYSVFLYVTLCFITIHGCKGASSKDDLRSSMISGSFAWLLPYRRQGGGPEILIRTISTGKGVSLRCVVGKPKLRIKWKKDGTTVVQSLRAKIKQFDWGSRLRIKNIQPSDEGVYRCVAKNRRGQKVSASAYVRVKGNRRNKQRRCQMYSGRLCSARLVLHGKLQYQADRRLGKIVRMLKSYRCRKQLIVFHCQLNYPSCSLKNNDKPQTVCREDCNKLEKKFCRRDVRILGSLWYQSIVCSKLPWTNCRRVFDHDIANRKHATNKTTVKPGKSTLRPRNLCRRYQGDICKTYMTAESLVTTHGQQSEVERGLRRVLVLLQNYTSSNCKRYLQKALCYHLFSPCSTGPHPTSRQICRLQCEVLQGRICSKEFHLARLLSPDSNILPWCAELPAPLDNDAQSCLSLGINVNDNEETTDWDKCSAFLKRNEKKKIRFTVMSQWLDKHQWCKKENITLPLRPHHSNIPKSVRKLFPRSNFSSTSTSVLNHQIILCFETIVRLKTLVLSWDHYHRSLPLPHLQIPLSTIQVPGVQVILDHVSSNLDTVLVPLGSAVAYRVHEKILLENVTFYYRYQSTRGSFIAKGHYRLCETVFEVSMERLENGAVKLIGDSSSPLDVNTIERVFGLATPTTLIQNAIRKSELLIMRIMSPSMQIYVDRDVAAVKFAGQSFWVSDGHSTFLEFYGGNLHQANILVASLTSESLTFGKVLRTFTGIELPLLDWNKVTSSQSRVGVLLSNSDFNSTHAKMFRITGEPLSTVLAGSIPAGLTIMSQTRVPGNCNGVKMCEIVKAAFGEDSLFKMKTICREDQVMFDMTFENVSHDALVAYKSIKVSLKVVNGNMSYLDVDPSITFHASGYINMVDRSGEEEKKLHFTGMLEYSGIWAKLIGQLDVEQYWKPAFNIPYLAFKNMHASFTVPTDTINSTPDHSISTSADFEFGVGCSPAESSIKKDNCITGQIFLGLSQDIREHYFYGSVGSVSLQQLLKACGLNVQLPTVVANTGFPSGLKISVARKIHDVGLEGGSFIRPGLQMSGTMNLLGIETDASISLLPTMFLIDAELDGLGMDIFDESSPSENVPRHDKEYRPVVYIKTRLNPVAFLKVNIDTYSRIFGVFDEISVLISRQMTQIKMVAEIHKSIQAHVYLMSNKSKHVNTTHLKAKIIFKNQLSKLTRLASKHVITMLEAEMSKLKVAEKEVERQSKECAKATKSACSGCLSDSSCLVMLSQCTQQKTNLHSLCQRTVRGHCQQTNGTCQDVCTKLASYLNDSCLAYHNAAKALQKLQLSLQWVRQARFLIAGRLFNIHSISFEAQVFSSDFMNTVVDTTFDVTIFGQRNLLTGLQLHLDSFSKLAAEIAKQAVMWYDKRHRLHSN